MRDGNDPLRLAAIRVVALKALELNGGAVPLDAMNIAIRDLAAALLEEVKKN